MQQAWHSYLVFDWKVGEALGGVLRRFLSLWLVVLIIWTVSAFTTTGPGVLIATVLWLAILVFIYQPANIFRQQKFSGASVPRPPAP